MMYKLDRNRESLEILEKLGKIDILVGIPSFKNQDTIGFVVEQVGEGLRKFFPSHTAVIMNSDGGSPDNTVQSFENAKVPGGIDRISSLYSGASGKGSAFRNIFEAAREMHVKGCVVVDSDLRSITPRWVELLLKPVMENTLDYVTPLYLRHKYDGTITNNFVYPITRALYGYDIRQPIGGDFGFSSKLLKDYLEQDVWSTDIARYGIDIWMTTTAVAKGYRVGQAALGAKIHDAKDPSIFLAPMFKQVVGTAFSMAKVFQSEWINVKDVKTAPLVGKPFDEEPEPVQANYDALVEKFQQGFPKYEKFWSKYLVQDSLLLLNAINEGLAGGGFSIKNSHWARLIYDFMIVCNKYSGLKDEILESMTPLYFIKIADFMKKSDKLNTQQSEKLIIEQADSFLQEKKYLIDRWKDEIH